MSPQTLLMEYTWNTTETSLNHTRLFERVIDEIKKLSRKVSFLTLAVFISLSFADLLLTKVLIAQSGGDIYEANPLANLILTYLGWSGLTIFKLGMVSLISSIVIYVAYYQPKTARRLLLFACILMTGIVTYSLYLLT